MTYMTHLTYMTHMTYMTQLLSGLRRWSSKIQG